MIEILNPEITEIPRLRELWKEAFSDEDGFLDLFFEKVFTPDHALVLKNDGKTVSALYIIDCEFSGQKIGYVYAVATDKAERGQGFATHLLEYSDKYMRSCGYSAALLRPANKKLFDFYINLGYDILLKKDQFEVEAEGICEIDKTDRKEFARKRRELAPKGAVLQDGSALALLEDKLDCGEGFLLVAEKRNTLLYAEEFLGDRKKAAAITAALGCRTGIFNSVGNARPFALLKNYNLSEIPTYFGIAVE